MDEFGDAGYSFFFIVLEIYGEEFSHLNSEQELRLSQTFLRRKLRKSSTKVQQLFNFYLKRKRIFSKIDPEDEEMYLIKVPKFIELASNWTGRTRKATSVGATEAPTAKEVEVDVDVDKERDKRKDFKEKEKERESTGTDVPTVDGDVKKIFDYHCLKIGNCKLYSPARKQKIKARLADGFSAANLCLVIDFVSQDDFWCGDNDRGKVFNQIETIFRSTEKTEKNLNDAQRWNNSGRKTQTRKESFRGRLQGLQEFHEGTDEQGNPL